MALLYHRCLEFEDSLDLQMEKKIPFQHLFNFIIKISRKWLLVYLLWRNVSVLPFARPRADATLDSRSRQTKELYSLLAIKKRKRLINNRSNN